MLPPSLTAVADFHAANSIARHDQDQRRYNDKTWHRNPGGSWFSNHCKGALRNRHRRERVEVMDDAYLFQQWRHQKVEPLPKIKNDGRDDWIAEKQTNDQKERAVTDAGE